MSSKASLAPLTNLVAQMFRSRAVTIEKALPIQFGGPAVYPDPNSLHFIVDGFSGNSSVYTITSAIGRKFGSIPRYVYKIKDQTKMREFRFELKNARISNKRLNKLQNEAMTKRIYGDMDMKNYSEMKVTNNLSKLLVQPNQVQGQDSFLELISIFYNTTGEAFVWKNRGLSQEDMMEMSDEQIDAVPPVEMYVIPSQYMELIPDRFDIWGIVSYRMNMNGIYFPLRKNDVIHWRRPNPNFDNITRSHLRGLSPLYAGNKILTQDDSSMDASVAMQQNQGSKGVLYNESLDEMDKEQENKLRQTIDRRINSIDLKSAVATLQGKWGYLDIGKNSVDMQLLDAMDKNFIKMCNLYQCPPMLFMASATYENIAQARKDFLTNLVLPQCASFRDELNRSLLKDFGLDPGSFTLDADVSNLSELQEGLNRMITQLATAWWLTPNQRLEAMNEEQSSDPLMNEVWIPNNMILLKDAAAGGLMDSYSDPKANAKKPKNIGNDDPDNELGGSN